MRRCKDWKHICHSAIIQRRPVGFLSNQLTPVLCFVLPACPWGQQWVLHAKWRYMEWSNWIEWPKKVRLPVSLNIFRPQQFVGLQSHLGPNKVRSDGLQDKLTIGEISLHTLKADWMGAKERYIALFVSGIFMATHAKRGRAHKKLLMPSGASRV